jgi:hypothetical protein
VELEGPFGGILTSIIVTKKAKMNRALDFEQVLPLRVSKLINFQYE